MNLKNKLSKQEEQRQNHEYGEFWWLPDGRGRRGMGEEVRGFRSTNRWSQNSHGDVKYSIGNGAAKQPMHDPWT